MRVLLIILLLATSTLSHAATLELVFNESSFSTTTTGTFRLTGEVPAMGYGSGGSWIGGTYFNDYHSFSSQYSLSFAAPPSASFDFYLSAYPSTGTAVRDSILYPIQGDYGISMNLFGGLGIATLQIYLQDQPDPGFGPSGYYPDNTLGMFMVNISGNFVASGSANGAAPASQGITFGNMEGTHQNQGFYTSDKFLTISVPEPSIASLLSISVVPLLLSLKRRLAGLEK